MGVKSGLERYLSPVMDDFSHVIENPEPHSKAVGFQAFRAKGLSNEHRLMRGSNPSERRYHRHC